MMISTIKSICGDATRSLPTKDMTLDPCMHSTVKHKRDAATTSLRTKTMTQRRCMRPTIKHKRDAVTKSLRTTTMIQRRCMHSTVKHKRDAATTSLRTKTMTQRRCMRPTIKHKRDAVTTSLRTTTMTQRRCMRPIIKRKRDAATTSLRTKTMTQGRCMRPTIKRKRDAATTSLRTKTMIQRRCMQSVRRGSVTLSVSTTNTNPCVCMECIYEEIVVDLNRIEVGDHILFTRAKYDHHAIVLKADSPVVDKKTKIDVAHATNSTLGFSADFVSRRGKANLMVQTIEIDLNVDQVIIYRYRPSLKPFPPEDVVKRALMEVEKFGSESYSYDLFKNNCEHFATYCVLGRRVSFQASKVNLFLKVWYENDLKTIMNDKSRNLALFKANLLCKLCFERNKCLLGVPYSPIMNGNDVKIGDVINYEYYKISHYAIITKVKEQSLRGVKCDIVHYKFSLFSKNTIVKENFVIPFDGSVKIVRYESHYEVYEPEDVVQNALGTIGDQRFVYFVNDSQHLAHMCKIKLMISSPTNQPMIEHSYKKQLELPTDTEQPGLVPFVESAKQENPILYKI